VTKIRDSRFPASGSPTEKIDVEHQLPLRGDRSLPHIAPLVLLLPMSGPGGLPLPIDADGPQVQHRLRPVFGPAHARLLQAILHPMPTRAFHHPRPDGPALRQILVIAHICLVAPIVACRPQQRRALRCGHRFIAGDPFQPGDNPLRFPPQHLRQPAPHPLLPIRVRVPQPGGDGIPQIFGGVNDVQHQRVLREVRLHLLLQCLRAIGQRHPLLDVGLIMLTHPLRQAFQRDGLARQRRAQSLCVTME